MHQSNNKVNKEQPLTVEANNIHKKAIATNGGLKQLTYMNTKLQSTIRFLHHIIIFDLIAQGAEQEAESNMI